MRALIRKVLYDLWKYHFFHVCNVLIFLFFAYINSKTPLSGDDWEVSQWFSRNDRGDILMFIPGIVNNWLGFNGRGLANFLMPFFTYHKELWVFFSAGLFTLLFNYFAKVFDFQSNKIAMFFYVLMTLSVSTNIRVETYSLICANVAFMLPLTLVVIYFKKHEEISSHKSKITKLAIGSIILYSLITSTLMEHISASFTVTLILLNTFYYLKNKKFDKLLLISAISSLLGSLFMFSSPGVRNTREIYSSGLGIMGTFQMSLPKNMFLLIYENKFIFACISMVMLGYMQTLGRRFSGKELILRYAYYVYMSVIASILTISSFADNFDIASYLPEFGRFITNRSSFIFSTTSFSVSLFWLVFIISFAYPLSLSKHKSQNFFIFFALALFAIIPSSFITQVGARIVAYPLFIIIGISSGLLGQVSMRSRFANNFILCLLALGLLNQVSKTMVLYDKIERIEKSRKLLVNDAISDQYSGEWKYDKPLVLPAFSKDMLMYVSNPPPLRISGHYTNFKRYFGLDPQTIVVFDDGFGYKELKLSKFGQSSLLAEIAPIDSGYEYEYILLDKSHTVIQTKKTTLTSTFFSIPKRNGLYHVECIMSKGGKSKKAYSADLVKI